MTILHIALKKSLPLGKLFVFADYALWDGANHLAGKAVQPS
jgi:hypothetical protein